ncbi:MAG TPA: PAS domain-containing protein [Candidatus Polarisedimenticolia bacterium]|nr:PAS domain-containing protein [Candidatus Polarisedimenticolia bacterium]
MSALRGESSTLRRIADAAAVVTGARAVHVALVDRDNRTLFGVVTSGRHPKNAPKVRYDLHAGSGALVALARRRPVVVRDAAHDRRVHPEARQRLGIGSVAYIPLLGAGHAFGLLILTTPRRHDWPAASIRLATYAATVASLAIQTTRLLDRLTQSEGRFRQLLEDIPAIVYTCEVEWPFRAHYVSAQTESLLGYPPSAWIEDPDLFGKLIHPEDVPRLVAEAAAALKGPGYSRNEYRLLDRQGNTRFFRDEAVLVRDPSGRPVAWHGVLVEVAARQTIEESPVLARGMVPPAPPRQAPAE